MHAGISADVRVVLNDHVAGQGGGVGHDHAVAEDAIVGDVGLGHQQTVVADLRQHSAAGGAAMDGYKLSNLIAPADARFGRFAFVLQILRRQADRNKRKDARVLAQSPCGHQ